MAKKKIKVTKIIANIEPKTIGTFLSYVQENEKSIKENLPWEIRRAFPEMALHGGNISFSTEGDWLTREEAINCVKLLLENLEQ